MNARLLVLMITAVLSVTPAPACEGLRAENGWVRLPPPGATSAAGYFSLHNAGPGPLRIIGVSSPDFETAMLHETRYVEGQAEMRALKAIELDADARFNASPGGAHLMLHGPHPALTESTLVAVEIECDSGRRLPLWLPVRSRQPD